MNWIKKNGESINVSDMSDSHLKNTYNMLRRKGFVPTDVAYSCLEYAGSASDGAAMAARAELSQMKCSIHADAVFDECSRRNIK